MATQATWIFDEVPPSGTRRGGNPSEHAFEHDLDTFVREVLQNSNDVIVSAPVEVDFTFFELRGEELDEFMDVMDWSQLRDHLDAAAAGEGGGNLKQQLDELTERSRLRVLVVEDRNTEGLTGAEAGESSNFTALCKDTLYSHKENSSAGGTHGLGKSVHWSFSGLSTVLFNSILQEEQTHESPRLIGRAELPSHELGGEWYTGSGWFGRTKILEDGDERAESVWDGEAAELASKLRFVREGNGTSIMIPGFRDPTRSEERTMDESATEILAAAAEYFWPALMGDSPRLSMSATVAGDQRDLFLSDHEELSNFVECYRASLRDETGEGLEEPGDIATQGIEVKIPPKNDERQGTTATATLAVRLAHDGDGELTGSVAPFRNSGMVIDYWDHSRVAVNARPFHAALICGEARNPRDPTAADSALEEFLRLAEPPAHDDWQSTEKLREAYKQGYLKAINQLKADVRDVLSGLTTPETSGSERGPDRLSRRFPISPRGRGGLSGGSGRGISPLHFHDLDGEFADDRWRFTGVIEPNEQTHSGWNCEVSLHRLGEGGDRLDVVPLSELAVESFDTTIDELDGGRFAIEAGEGVSNVEFTGRSTVVDDAADIGEVELGLKGTLHTED